MTKLQIIVCRQYYEKSKQTVTHTGNAEEINEKQCNHFCFFSALHKSHDGCKSFIRYRITEILSLTNTGYIL